jgi:hypothetical protein
MKKVFLTFVNVWTSSSFAPTIFVVVLLCLSFKLSDIVELMLTLYFVITLLVNANEVFGGVKFMERMPIYSIFVAFVMFCSTMITSFLLMFECTYGLFFSFGLKHVTSFPLPFPLSTAPLRLKELPSMLACASGTTIEQVGRVECLHKTSFVVSNI